MTFARGAGRAVLAGLASLIAVTVSAPPALADQNRDDQWYLKSLKVAEAHRVTKGAGVTVAVIDNGLWPGHPDLKGAVLPGQNVFRGGAVTEDLDGHGTSMAGIIGARGHGGGRGILGIAPEAKILPVTPYNDAVFLKSALQYAIDQGAKVINMSFGVNDFPTIQRAMAAAAAADVVLIAASGNKGDEGNKVEYPAGYPEVLAVGAVDRNGKVPPFSNYGAQIDLVAPGVDMRVLDTKGENDYATSQGTSDAAAVVSGAAALIRAKNPKLSAAQVVQILTSTAQDAGPKGRDDKYGFGRLDLMAALNAPTPPGPGAPTAPPQAATDAPAGAGTQPPVAYPPIEDRGPQIPPVLFVAAGGVLLIGAVIAVVLIFRRSSRT